MWIKYDDTKALNTDRIIRFVLQGGNIYFDYDGDEDFIVELADENEAKYVFDHIFYALDVGYEAVNVDAIVKQYKREQTNDNK